MPTDVGVLRFDSWFGAPRFLKIMQDIYDYFNNHRWLLHSVDYVPATGITVLQDEPS